MYVNVKPTSTSSMNLGSFMLPKYRIYFSNFMYQIKTLHSWFFEDNCKWHLLKSQRTTVFSSHDAGTV